MFTSSQANTQHYHNVCTILERIPIAVALYDAQQLRLLEANDLFITLLRRYLSIPHYDTYAPLHPSLTDQQHLDTTLRKVVETCQRFVGHYLIPKEDLLIPWILTVEPIQNTVGHIHQLLVTLNEVPQNTSGTIPVPLASTIPANTYVYEEQRSRSTPLHPATISVQHDIHLQTQAEQERIRLHTIFDELSAGVLWLERSGNVSYINPPGQLLLHREDFSPLLYPSSYEGDQNYDACLLHLENHSLSISAHAALSGKMIRNQEIQLTTADGLPITMHATALPIHGGTGEVNAAVILLQHAQTITGLDQERQEFLSLASHELRTPITAIQGFAELLHMQISQYQQLQSTLILRATQGITEYSQRLSRLIEDMLDLSLLDKTQLFLHRSLHDLHHTLLQVIEMQTLTSRRHQFDLILDGLQPDEPLPGYFDEDRIMQILTNLVTNAIKYSPQGGQIEIGLRCTHPQEEAVIWVKDQGIGMSPRELPHIFERYYRSPQLDHAVSGLGIGLYLVKELVTRHGGHVWAESNEGHGSCFYLRLPLYAA